MHAVSDALDIGGEDGDDRVADHAAVPFHRAIHDPGVAAMFRYVIDILMRPVGGDPGPKGDHG